MPDGTAQQDKTKGKQAHGQGTRPRHDPHPQRRNQAIGKDSAGQQKQKNLDIPTNENQITKGFRQSC